MLQFSFCFPLFRTQEEKKEVGRQHNNGTARANAANEELQITKTTTEFFIIKIYISRFLNGMVSEAPVVLGGGGGVGLFSNDSLLSLLVLKINEKKNEQKLW